MFKLVLLLALSFTMSGTAESGELSAADIARLKAEVGSIMAALEKGDPEDIISRTHPSLHALAGGKEAFAKLTRDAVEQLLESGIKFISADIGTPTRTYSAGAEEVCFVPRVSVMEVQGKRLKSTSFMIAIRRVGDSEWKYLDGAGLRNNPDILSRLLPDLEPGVKYPENVIVAL